MDRVRETIFIFFCGYRYGLQDRSLVACACCGGVSDVMRRIGCSAPLLLGLSDRAALQLVVPLSLCNQNVEAPFPDWFGMNCG